MPRYDYVRCRGCGKHRSVVGLLSHTRLCASCGREILLTNIDGLHYKRGEPLQRWRRAMAASVGAVLLDDAQESP